MPIIEEDLVVHAKNPRWGMPLCWNPKADITLFEASYFEDDVDCPDCKTLLEE